MLLSLIPQLVFAIPPDQANPGEHAAVVISELNLPDHVYDRVVANHYGAVLDTKPVRLNKNSFKKIWLENEQRYLNADSKALVGQFVNLPLLAGEVIRLNVEKVEM
ncbi:MAG: hypothetical protein KDI92_06485, partial [Xanthomonadales bacterium]|nr:hypothetical protein [Xanthomonadales bacterium]